MKQVFVCLMLTATFFSCKKDKDDPVPLPPVVNATDALNQRYIVSGTMTDYSNATYTGSYPDTIEFKKVSENEGKMFPTRLGIDGHLIRIGGSLSYYSNYSPSITFDTVTNKIVSILNSYGQPSSNGRSAELDPSGVNSFDPATKTIRVKYWLNEPALIMPHRTLFDETWTILP